MANRVLLVSAITIATWISISCQPAPSPSTGADSLTTASPADEARFANLSFPDPDGENAYSNFPWIELGAGKTATLKLTGANSHYEQALLVFEVGPSSSPAEFMRFGTASHHNRNQGGKLVPGRRYYFAAWHKHPSDSMHITAVNWTASKARLVKDPTGYRVQVDDADPATKEGDGDFDDFVITVSVV